MKKYKKKSKKIAGLLGIFLGFYGVHNFYIHRYIRAIIQILITTFIGLPLMFEEDVGIVGFVFCATWGIVEGILILCDAMDINAKYRIYEGTKEENEEFALKALKKYPYSLDKTIKYITKHTNLSLDEINKISNESLEKGKKLKEENVLLNQEEKRKEQNSKIVSDTTKLNTQQNNTQVNAKSNKDALIGFIVVAVIVLFIVIKTSTSVSDNTGEYLATKFFEDDSRYSSSYIDAVYAVGKVKSYDSKIIENNGDKYIFKIVISYNPKLNNGSTDLSKEDNGTTYLVYNKKTKKYICCKTLEKAKATDIWKNN